MIFKYLQSNKKDMNKLVKNWIVTDIRIGQKKAYLILIVICYKYTLDPR